MRHQLQRGGLDSLLASVAAEVPFVAQGPLLCGGAAAAMVERFWGARGVYAEDFGALVHPHEGGIRGRELAAALEARGYVATIHQDDPAVLTRTLEAGAPLILLLDADARSLHYVVAVGLDEHRYACTTRPVAPPGAWSAPSSRAAGHAPTIGCSWCGPTAF